MSKIQLFLGFVGFAFLIFGGSLYSADLPEPSADSEENASVPGFTPVSTSISEAAQNISGYPTPIGENSGVLSEANRFYQAKRFFDAEKLYNLYVSQNAQVGVSTDLALAYHRLGLIAKKRQLYDNAQQYLISAIKSDPAKDPQITLDYAIILFELGEYERAEKLFRFLCENNPDLEQAKIYLGKTLLELDPSIDLLPLLEAEYSRVEAGELLAERCRAAGKTQDAEKLEKMIFSEKMKGDEVFFAPADSAAAPAEIPAPSVAQSMPNVPAAPVNGTATAPNDRSADFEAFAATVPSKTGAEVLRKSDFAPFAADDSFGADPAGDDFGTLGAPTFEAAQDAYGALSEGARTNTLGGYPGLTMNDGDGVVLEKADPAYAEAKPTQGKVTEQFAPFADYEKEAPTTLAETRRGVSVPRAEENYGGFDGYLPPGVPSPKVSASTELTHVEVGSAPTPDFAFVDEICFHDPEKVALQQKTPKSAAPISVRTSPKASPLTNAQAKPLRDTQTLPQGSAVGARRLSSDEKLQMAEKAGAEITYLTKDQYNTEIATRAGKVVQHAEEEISNSQLKEEQKQDLLQKILGL